MKRGTQKDQPAPVKQNMVSSEVYSGSISRSYEGKTKYSVNPKGEKPFESYSKRTLDQMRQRYPESIVNQIKY
jgi:hypothetical protein